MNKISEYIASSESKFDLTSPDSQRSLYDLSNKLLSLPEDEIVKLYAKSGDSDLPLEFRMAIHLLKSKRYIQSSKKALKLSVVFAMWGENNRLLSKSENNPNGEDTLRTKIDQLNWLFESSPIDWKLYVVDDGCPHGSGRIAQEIIEDHPDKKKVEILFLEDVVKEDNGSFKDLHSVDESRKGGAIIYGAREAIKDGMDVIIYTDADNSVHLGQIGILLKEYIEDDYKVVLGNRKDSLSVLVKQENRWGIGIKLLRHMQRMVGVSIFSKGILDSQAAFKLYDAELLRDVIANPSVYDFSFDSDWIAAILKKGEAFAKVPFAFIDSFAESASIVQGPMTTWETLLLGLVKSLQQRGLAHNKEMAKVLEEEILSSKDLDLLIDSLPPQLENVKDEDLGDPELMSPEEIREWIRRKKI